MPDLFDVELSTETNKSININTILTAVYENKSLLHLTAVELSVDEKSLETFLMNNILVKSDSIPQNVCKNNSLSEHSVDGCIGAEIHTDGGSRGNPGVAGCGIVIEYDNGQKIGYYYYLGTKTNNEAEYSGLKKALEILLKNNIKEVRAFADSELMCNQINGIYKVKNENLKSYYDEVKSLISQFKSFSLTHVLRGKNSEADKLANIAMDSKKNGETELTVVG